MGRTLLAVLALAVAAGAGCTPAALSILTSGDQKKPPEHPLPVKGDKKEVTVAVLPSADPGVGGEFIGVERELARLLGKKLAEGTKDAKKVKPIKVIELSKVEKYTSDHPMWQVSSAGKVGQALGADYLLDMRVNSISMYDPAMSREAYVGQATITVAVYDSDDPDRPMMEYVHPSHQPAKDTNVPPSQYRQLFLDRLATELSWRHVPHVSERELGPIK